MNLKEEYEFIRMLEKEIEKRKIEIQMKERIIQNHKKDIRFWRKLKEKRDREPKWRCHYNDDGYDRRFRKEVFDGVWNKEDCDEYRKENWEEWYNPWEDGRDCTGVWFTTRIAIFPIKATNKTIVYHFQSCDV